MERSSGVLMHVSSLFGKFSVGSFGDEAKYFIDFLSESGFSYWQVLPFCMPDEFNSPYKSYSSFGANPYFIDLPTLYECGLLTAEELRRAVEDTPYLAEYDRLSEERISLLSVAASRVKDRSRVLAFINENPELENAARYLALREKFGGAPWQTWGCAEPDGERLFFWQFVQYEFYRQWGMIKSYANAHGIKIIGDLPIYVATESVDVWAHREEFQLDPDGYPTSVAGVPPDYFSEDGQLWGNPLYDYNKMKKNGYKWWRERIRFTLRVFDGVRIDHFRGFESYFSIPKDAKTAKDGKWVKGPDREIIDVIKDEAGEALVIAEDLGDITPAVRDLLEYSGLPGMRVFQFGFLGDPITPHLPHNYSENSVAYSGTHDNNTLLGYIWEMDSYTRDRVFDYCGARSSDFSDGVEAIRRTLLASHSSLVIFPVQDILGYGRDTRMNTPGKASGNWQYRITREQLDSIDRRALREQNRLFGRIK